MPFVKPIRKKMKCYMRPDALLNKPNNQGDVKANRDKLTKPNRNVIQDVQAEGSKNDDLVKRRKKLLDAKVKEGNEALPKEVKKKAANEERRAAKLEKGRAAKLEKVRAAKLEKVQAAKAARKVLEEKYQA